MTVDYDSVKLPNIRRGSYAFPWGLLTRILLGTSAILAGSVALSGEADGFEDLPVRFILIVLVPVTAFAAAAWAAVTVWRRAPQGLRHPLGAGAVFALLGLAPGFAASFGGVGAYPIYLVAAAVFGVDLARLAGLRIRLTEQQSPRTPAVLKVAATVVTVAAAALIFWEIFVMPVVDTTTGPGTIVPGVAGAYWSAIAVVACVNAWVWVRFSKKLSVLDAEHRRAAIVGRTPWLVLISWNLVFGLTLPFLVPVLFMVSNNL